uniref:Uncharacterized protein n=1 Tax=Arundo donax TaxID=35708 RepID=A0A0A9F9U4_ARUDO
MQAACFDSCIFGFTLIGLGLYPCQWNWMYLSYLPPTDISFSFRYSVHPLVKL